MLQLHLLTALAGARMEFVVEADDDFESIHVGRRWNALRILGTLGMVSNKSSYSGETSARHARSKQFGRANDQGDAA
jgi:hypothetical protein